MTTNNDFRRMVSELIESGAGLTTAERIAKANELIEKFVEETGKAPPDDQVERLTDFVLRDELSSNNKRRSGRPIYTDEQLAHNARRTGVQINIDEISDALTYGDILTSKDVEKSKRPNGTEAAVHKAIRSHPEASNRQIGRELGVSHTLVRRYRKTMSRG